MTTKKQVLNNLTNLQRNSILRYMEIKTPTDEYVSAFSRLLESIEPLRKVVTNEKSQDAEVFENYQKQVEILNQQLAQCFRAHGGLALRYGSPDIW